MECGSVNTFLCDDIAAEILHIPISRYGGIDFSHWPFTKSGQYTVRSAYNMQGRLDFLKLTARWVWPNLQCSS